MKTCYSSEQAAFPIKLEQRSGGRFRVTYGLQVKDHLAYSEAARELGACIMHAAACDGLLDSDAP